MKKSRYLFFFVMGIFMLWTIGCWLPQAVSETKKQMDLAEQINKPVDVVWNATLDAAEDLAITVDEKTFDGKKGIISGHKEEMNFIRIHIEQLEPELTLVGVQARKEAFTLKLQIENARVILDQIKKILAK